VTPMTANHHVSAHEPIVIDGAAGEGGGQVLRSSLALSMALGIPFRIVNIRANRDRPGLMRQHLTAVQAAVAIGSARCEGASVGSRELLFVPGAIAPGSYRFTIGTAGSTTLVLQAILPPLLVADAPSELVIEGGTHARWAPPYEFFERALVPTLARCGARIDCAIERHGFYPAGGGVVRVRVEPSAAPTAVTLDERGELVRRSVAILIAKLPTSIARRELEVVQAKLAWECSPRDIREVTDSIGPGNAVVLDIESEHAREVCCTLGEHGKRAESVAAEAVDLARAYLAAQVPIGRHLADQLMVPFAIIAARSGSPCGFVTMPLSRHAHTNSELLAAFLERTPVRPPRVTQLDEYRVRWEVG
jgi:RNA 3'-terminal phosphate cyclase (ATP)